MVTILIRKHTLSNHLGGKVWCIIPFLASIAVARCRDAIIPRRVRVVRVPLIWHVAPAMGVLVGAIERALVWVRAKRG